ncbi:hypothetical protein GCM10023149_32780 [Mucilaginibacter gynuensis]|uniref:Aerotolerance regulator N-terminal domain-containing protein n=1 Tax=Mucilaginibacter gynuensis TaxID=1302236 RepID=A0ABP8GQZ5_9SPHI
MLIHLWNIRPGKVLKVGSISLISETSRKSSRSFKVTDVPLLLLRCLLLVLLAFLLAQPVWQQWVKPAKSKGWVLIPKTQFAETYQKFKPQTDSLLKAGYELHYFNKGFTVVDTATMLKDTTAKDTIPTNYWTLVTQLNSRLNTDAPVYIFSPNRMAHFAGNKPSVALNLHWQTYTPADSVSNWVAKAWLGADNNIKVLQGNSQPSGTTFTTYTIPPGGDANSPFVVNITGGQVSVSLKNRKQTAVGVDTVTYAIAIYTDKYPGDAAYLIAALKASARFAQRKISIRQYQNADRISGKQEWLFWLSDKAPGKQVVQNAKNLFTYKTGRAVNANSWISAGPLYAASQTEKVALYKRVEGKSEGKLLWHDGFGNPVLSMAQNGKTNEYQFYNRFNPQWSNLVWSYVFPKWLFRLTNTNPESDDSNYDRRVMADQQIQPHIIPQVKNAPVSKVNKQVELSNYLWFVLALVFFAERWLAHKNRTEVRHG